MSLKKLFNVNLIPISLLHFFHSSPIQVPAYNIENYNQEIQAIYNTNIVNPNQPISKNIVNTSQYFLGRTYALFNMGEGSTGQFDQNPLYRTDKFDCESYVMVVLALSKAHDLASFIQNLIHINYYSPQPNFIYRNHFTSCQWNTNNQKNGYIKDITTQIYPNASNLSIKINLQEWFSTLPMDRIQTLNLLSNEQAKSLLKTLHETEISPTILTCHLTYIPTNALLDSNAALLKKIPNASIIEIVNSNKKWQDAVTHMGFAIYIHHQLYFREASKIYKKTIDTPMTVYLKQVENIGINIEEVN